MVGIVVSNGILLIDYTNRLRATGLPLNEAKLVLVGQGAVGKSNIAKRLRALDLSNEEIKKLLDERGVDLRFNPNYDETQDFDIANWPVHVRRPGEDRDRDVRVRLLDFAGQDITHATHQFFLTARCVCLLVLDGTKSIQWNRLDYWLRLIWHYAGPSPVLVAVNKADLKPGIDLSQLTSIVTDLAKLY
jgi:small GTP-binding protein